MKDWAYKLDSFLKMTRKNILNLKEIKLHKETLKNS